MGVALWAYFISTLLLSFAAFAQDETPPKTTPPDEAVESATDEDLAPDDDLAPEIEESFGIEPILSGNIEEIMIHGEAGGMLVKDDTVSVMAFDPGVLQVEGIKDIRDLSNFTPSLEIKSAFAASNPTIYIRGVGLDDFNANAASAVAIYQDAASAVAIYQDDVYLQSPAIQLAQFYDVEQIEVLRGPQGTRYRNASAGAILLHSNRPNDEFAGSVTATYGNYELWEVEGFVGGPIVPDYLSGRLSGTWAIRDGLTKNRCAAWNDEPDPDEVPVPCNHGTSVRPPRVGKRFAEPGIDDRTNDIDNWAARGQLLLNLPIGDTETEWLLNVHGGQNRSRAFQYQHTGVNIVVDGKKERPVLFNKEGGPKIDRDGYRDKDGGDPFAGDYNIDGPEDIDLWGANLRGTWLFGDGQDYELKSVTAYEWHDLFRVENTDGSPKFSLESTYTDTSWQASQQFDLQGPIRESQFGDGDWGVGAFYIQEDLDVSNFYDQNVENDLFQEYTQEMWNFAVYAEMEYRIQPGCERVSCDFTFLGGLRYNWEHKSFDTSVDSAPGNIKRSTLKGQDDALWRDWSGDFSLAWNYSDDSNIYIKYSRGWKGGHFNGGALSVFDIITGVNPEIVDSYEAGLRSNWFDQRVKFNLTGFYYDYLDLQVFIVEQTPLGYPIPKLANASDAIVYGVELDLQAEPLDGLWITLNAAWVESEYKEFVVSFQEQFRFPRPPRPAPPPDPLFIWIDRKFDYSGNTLIASPNFSVTGSIEYEIALPGEIAGRGLGTLTPRFSFSWKDELLYDACGGRGNRCNFTDSIAEEPLTQAAVGNEGFFGQEPFWIFNAALTWTSENEMLMVSGWVHNFMDEHYKTQSFDLSRGLGVILDAYATPRTYGITATLSF
ncbi:MAG: TonB-dependent receptor plug domain-containing protein [Deltaproteobacteria bacterium]|nr:TonB-dependent receptor plug domain-containing protein [Deltaproteobacteria bacterium]